MKPIYLFLITGLVLRCASLAPVEKRQIRNVIEVKGIKADVAYDRALVWFAKSLVNANWAVQIRDKANGRIVANMSLQCQGLTNALDSWAQNVSFTADFQAKDDRYRLTFEQIYWEARSNTGNTLMRGPSDDEDLAKIDATCLASVRNSLQASVGGSKKADDNF